jgi:hypothetical protein
MILGVEVALNRCTLFCLAKLTCKLFDGWVERGTQAVGHILSALGKLDSWLVPLCMGRINRHMLCIVGVILINGCVFILSLADAAVKEQIITVA